MASGATLGLLLLPGCSLEGMADELLSKSYVQRRTVRLGHNVPRSG